MTRQQTTTPVQTEESTSRVVDRGEKPKIGNKGSSSDDSSSSEDSSSDSEVEPVEDKSTSRASTLSEVSPSDTDKVQKINTIHSVSFPEPSFKSNQGFDPFLVVEDPKLVSLCEVIKNIKVFHPTLAQSVMANQGLVKTIHDMIYADIAVEGVGIPSMHSSTILQNSNSDAPAASTKPTPLQHISYRAIADGECFLHYIKRCGGTSVESAAVIISQILKEHGITFINSPNRKKDNGLEHIV